MKPDPQRKYAVLFEALKRSLIVTQRLHRRLSGALVEVAHAHEEHRPFTDLAIDALIDAISLVDFLHRYRMLAEALPLVSNKEDEVKALQRGMADIEAARHYLQHLRGDLSANAGVTYPVLGALMWVTDSISYTLQYSQTIEADIKGIQYVSRSGPVRSGRLKLRCKESMVDLDAAQRQAEQHYAWLNTLVVSTIPGFADLTWGETLLMRMGPLANPK